MSSVTFVVRHDVVDFSAMSTKNPSAERPRPRVRRWAAFMVASVIGALLVVGDAAQVSAHTGFESSEPSSGAVVDQPVGVVTIVFTGEANPVGDQFVVLTPDGELQRAVSIETTDDKVFSIRFDPPLSGGEIGVRWNVQAADAHPIEGAFSFTVNAAAPTTAPATTVPPTAPPATESAQDVAAAPGTGGDADLTANPALTSPQTLDEFLTIDESTPGETTATVGRVVGFLGVALGLGALVFVATALRGRRREIHGALAAVRLWGGVIALGALIEYVGVTRISGESLMTGWSTAPGFATIIRVAGGVGLAFGLAETVTRGHVQRLIRRPSVVRSLSAAVADDLTDRIAPSDADSTIYRWRPDSRSWPALGGAALIIASFWFDGHTVSKGFRPFHALVNSVHVAAGAVWVGGVVAMAAVIWTRHRAGRPMRAVELVVRFSKIATVALAGVVLAGGLMAILVLDSFGELTGTPWGRILLLKTGAVALAMIGGAYNHFRLLPALESDPESPELLDELRSTVTAEAIMLVFVVVVTAWLVAAAS